MKYLRAYRRFIGTLMMALMLSWQIGQPLHAATIYWDSDANASGDNTMTGAGLGGAGNWNNSLSTTPLLNWYNGTSDTSWVNANNDRALFWGTAGTVTLTDNVTVGGLIFNTTGYTINGNTNTKTLTFGAANNVITLNNVAAAAITSGVTSVAGGNMTLSGGIYGGLTAGTLTFNGTQSGTGWSGTTTINNGMIMAVAGSNLALAATTGITLNGGGITLTNTTAGDAALNRVADGAGITSNGGTITVTNTASATVAYSETLGTIALTSGQLNIVSTNANTTPAETLTLGAGSLTHAAANTSAITFAGASLGLNAKNSVIVTSQATTAVGTIIGPWATWGTTAALQTDYATYNITGGVTNAFGIQNAAIAASADSTWTNAANAYTNNTAALTLGATAHNMLGLRNTAATATITTVTGGNLNTYGLLNGVTTLLTVAATGTGALSTPTGGGNLFVSTGDGAITISAPINDNGGAVTLVRTGTAGALTLSSTTSNYSGGTVIGSGVAPTPGAIGSIALSIGADSNLGATTGGLTFNSSGTLQITANLTLNASRTITINNGALAKFTEAAFDLVVAGKVTGSGGVMIESSSGTHGVTLSNTANDFQGPLIIGFTSNTVTGVIASLADSASANGAIRLLAGTGNAVFQWSTAAVSALTLNNRQFDLMGTGGTATIDNSNATAANAITVNTDLIVSGAGAKTFTLQGANTGNNTFAGKIADGTSAVISLNKAGAGTWILSGNNIYTGTTTVAAGLLNITGSSANGAVTINNAGTFKINGAGGISNAPITVNAGGTLIVDNTAASGGVVANRLTSKDLTLAGGVFNYNLGGSATAATDSINTLTAASAGGYNVSGLAPVPSISLTAATSGAASVTVASLARTAGGALLIQGANLGATPGTGNTNLIVTSNAASADVIGGTGAAGSTTISINSFIVGQDTALVGNAQFGFMTDKIGGSMLVNGLRILTPAEYLTTIGSGQSTLDNISLTGFVTGINSATTINSLRLDIGGNVVGSGTLTVNSGGILSLGSTSAFSRRANSISGGTLAFGSQEAIISTIYSDLTVNSQVTAAGGLTKTGDGLLILGGTSNSIAGQVIIASGILRATSVGAVSSTGSLVVGNRAGAMLDLSGLGTTSLGFDASYGSLAGGGAAGGSVLLGGGATLTVGSDNTSTSFGGGASIISGAGNLVKNGIGTLTLAGANVYNGTTTINGGTLKSGLAAFLPASTAVTLTGSGALDINGLAVTIASLTSSSTTSAITNTGGTAVAITLGNLLSDSTLVAGVNTTYSGVFNATTAANLQVTKSGAGTLTLNGQPGGTAITGAWTLNAGIINLDFSTSTVTSNIIAATVPPTLQGGTLQVTGKASTVVSQTLGAVTAKAGFAGITLVDGGGSGQSTTLQLGALAATTAGGTMLITAPANTTVKTSTVINVDGSSTGTNGRLVFSDGAGNYNWATNNNSATTPLNGTAVNYTANLNATTITAGTSDANNSLITLTGSGQTTTLGGTWQTHTLKIDSTTVLANTGGVLSLGGTLTLDANQGGILFTGSNDYTISGASIASAIATNSDVIINTFGTGKLTVSSAIANTGTGTLTKGGTGTLVLGNAANAYTGVTFITSGTLSISAAGNIGGTTAAITISDGAILQATASLSTGTHTYSFTGGNATFDVTAGNTLTINGVASGVGGLTLKNSSGSGTGTLLITAAATYSGPTFVQANTKLLGGVATSLNAATGGNLNVLSGGLVDMGNFTMTVGGIAGSGNIVNSGATAGTVLTVGGNNLNTTYTGILQGSGTAANLALTKNGFGTLTLGSVNLYTGATLLQQGTIQLGVDNALAAATAITLGNALAGSAATPVNAVLDLNGHALTLSATTALTFYGTTSTNFNQARVNIGAGGNLTLGGNVTSGVNATAASGFLGAFISGGTLTMTAARTFTIVDSLNAAADLTITSTLAGTGGGITKAGAGNLVLAGVNNTTGANIVQVGTLTAAVNGALSSGGTWTVTATGAGVAATLDLSGTVQSLNNVLTLGGSTATSTPVVNLSGGTLSILGGIAYAAASNPLTGQINGGILDLGSATRTITVGNSTSTVVDLSISSVISGLGGVTFAGLGQVLLSGQSTYSGNTTLSAAGIVQAGVNNALPFGSGKGSLIINAGTFDLNGFNASVNAVSSVAVGTVDNTSASGVALTLTGTGVTGVYNFVGSINSSGSGGIVLTKNGAYLQTISGSAAIKGALAVNGGTLALLGGLSNPGAITGVTVAGGSTLNLLGSSAVPLPNLTTLNLGAGSGTTTLGLNLGATAGTLTSSTAATTANSVVINLSTLSGAAPGTYTLLSAPSGLSGATYTISAVGGFATTAQSISDTAVSVTLGAAAATTLYWKGGVDNAWNTLNGSFQSNWTDSTGAVNSQAMPGFANTAIFSASGQSGTSIATTLGMNVTINDLQFNNARGSGPVGSISIAPGADASNTLTIAPSSSSTGITVQTGAPANINISAQVNLGASQTWTVVDPTTALTVSGVVLGAAGNSLNVAGAGTLILSSSGNLFGGAGTAVNVQSGTLQFSADAQLGNSLNTLSLGTSSSVATLQYTGATATIARNIALGTLAGSASGNIINVASGAALTLSGVISGGAANGSVSNGTASANAALQLTGGGTFILSGTNTFVGDIIVSGSSTLSAGALANFGAAGGASGNAVNTPKQVFIQSGSTFAATASLNPQATATGPNSAFFVFGQNSSSSTTVNVATGAVFTLDDPGQLTLNGALNLTGAGTLILGNTFDIATAAFGSSTLSTGVQTGSSINVGGTAILQLQANAAALGGAYKAPITLNSGTTLDLRLNSGGTFGNNVTIAGNATIQTGRTTASATNITQTMGTLSIGGQTLTFANGNGNTAPGVANLAFTSTTLTGNTTFNLTNINVAGVATLNLGAVNDGGTARTITLTGTGALGLSAAATSFTGTINVTGGSYLILGAAGANTGTVNVLNGTIVYGATGANATGTVNLGDTTGSSVTTLAIDVNGAVVDNAFVIRDGSSGATNITTLSTPALLGLNMPLGGVGTISAPITLAKSSGAVNFGAAANTTLVISGAVGESGGAKTFNVVGPGNVYLLGDKNFTGGINLTGGGALILGNGPTPTNFSGNISINGGLLVLLGGYTLPGAITYGALGGSLLYAPGAATTDYSSSLTLTNGSTLLLDVAAGLTVTYATAFGGGTTASLTKTGGGTLNLAPTTGSETYTGATTVGAGVLALNFVSGGTSSNILSSAALQMQGGTLTVNGGTSTAPVSQAFTTTAFQAGGSTITLTKGTASTVGLTLGAITRSAGATINFSLLPASTSINISGNSNNAAGILGGWATYSTSSTLTDWAMNNGSGLVAPYAGYLAMSNANANTGTGTTNFNIASGTITPTTNSAISVNSLRMQANSTILALGTANSLTINSTNGGIMYALTSGTGTISGTAALSTGLGMVTTGTASGGELLIYVNAGGTLTISAGVGGKTGISDGFGITKSGGGTLKLTNGTTGNLNNYTGQTVINGGVLQALDSTFIATSSGITLNGGTLFSGGTGNGGNLTQPITLGLSGGTLSYNSTAGTGSSNGGWNSATPIAFLGSGSRTLTLAGTDTDRTATLVGALGDGGGPTSLVVSGGSALSGFVLSGANSYSGSTTLQGGFLVLNNATALPSMSNLIFNGTTVTTELEINATSGASFTRSLGTGPGQVQWLGNGGFSAGAGTNTVTGLIVNLGGAAATVTWGSGGFVPSGSTLSFDQGSLGAPSVGMVDFQNGIDFGSLTTRTIDVGNGTYAFNTAGVASSITAFDAKLSGSLISTITGGFTKSGNGVLWVNGNNTGFLGTITITNGFTLFSNANALPVNANSLLVTSNGTNATAGVVLQGQTNFNTLLSRLNTASTGTLALDTSSSENINFNALGLTNARFGAFGTVVYQGLFTPGTAGVYKLNGPQNNDIANAAGLSALVLTRQNAISGTSSTLDIGTGILLLASSNAFGDALHGVNIQPENVQNNGTGGSSAVVYLAKDGALGSGTITLTNAQAISANPALVLGAAYGDHTIANNILINNNGGPSNLPYTLAGDTTTDLVPSAGRMTYSGNLTFQGAGNIVLGPRTTGFIFNGSISSLLGTASTMANLHLSGGATLVVFNNLSNSSNPSTFNSPNLYLSGALTFLIGNSRDLGDTVTAGRLLNFNSNAVFGILPGVGDITTSANITITDNAVGLNKTIDVPTTQTLKFTSGLISLKLTGQLYTKTGTGTFDIGAILNPGAGSSTWGTTGIEIKQGTFKADFGNAAAATNIIGLANSVAAPLTLSGGTLLLVGKSGTPNTQAFGALAVNQGASAITLNSNGSTLVTSFTSMGTRSAGGTVALTLPTDGPASVSVPSGLVAQNTLLVDAAATKSAFMVIGPQGGDISDWAAVSGTTIVALSNYTATTGTTISGNATVATTVDTTLAANASADSLRFNLAESRTLNLNGKTLNVGGILVTASVGANASTISGGSLTTASGAAANADLVIYQANKGASLNISSSIIDNGANAVSLTKSGAGELVLSGASSNFSGSVFLNEGKVTFNAVSNLGSGAGNLNLNGADLHYTGAADAANAGTLTQASVNVARPTTLDVDSGSRLTLTGTVTSTLLSPIFELLTKTGQGTISLDGSSNNVLNLDVQQGTVILNKSGGNVNAVGVFAINVLSNVGLTIEDGALVQLGGGAFASGDQILNTSSVQLNGSSTLDLAGHNETIDGLGGELGSLITNSSASGAVLTVGFASMALGAPKKYDGNLRDGTGTLGLTMIGGNIFTLTGNNTYTGKTTITGQQYLTTGVYFGGISISSESNLGSNPDNFTVDQWTLNGGRLVMTDDVTLDASRNNVGITLGAGGGIFEVAATKTFTIAAANIIAGAGGFTKEGLGTVLMQGGANTYTGRTILNQGVLSISAQGALGSNPAALTADQLTFNGGQLETTATLSLNDSNRGVTIAGYGGTLTADAGTTLTLANVISGTGDLTLNGAGIVVLGGVNTPWTGKTLLQAGELQISSNVNLGSPPATAVADQLQISNNAIFHLTSDMTFNVNRGITIGTGGATITTDSAKLVTINGVVTLNAGTLTKAGAGTLVLSGSDVAVSGTQVAVMAGVLRLGSAGALSSNSNLNISGGVVELASTDFTRALGTGNNQVQFTASGGFSALGTARTVNLGGAGATVTWNSGSFVPTGSALVLSSSTSDNTVTFQNGIDTNGAVRTVQVDNGSAATDAVLAGGISDSGTGGGILKTGAGTLALTGSSTYSGTTQISGGKLLAGVGGSFSSSSAYTLDNTAGVSLDLNGTNQVIGSLAGGGTTGGNVALGSGTLTTGGNNQSTVYNGTISGVSGNLTKTGSGSMSLTNAQTYTGLTNVSGGSLFVNSTLASSGVTVGASGTLGGSGSISGLTTVNSGGTIQAGDIAGNGSLALTGGLTFQGLGTINVGQIAEAAPNILNVGTLTTGSSISSIVINIIASSSSGYANGTPYTLLTYTGGAIQGSAGFSAFTLGTIAGTNSRTTGLLTDTGSAITLTLNADNPKWTGFDSTLGASSSRWVALPSVLDWKLISAASPTAYIEGDVVLFDDSAVGSTTVDISDGDVNPSSVTFNNSTKTYTITGTNGIAGTANFTKSNVGTVVITNANSFNGGVLLNGGVIQLGNSLALGTTNGLLFGAGAASGTKLQINGNSITLTGLNTNVTTPGSAVVENGAAGVDATLTLNLQTTGTPPSGEPVSVYAGVLQDGSTGKLGLTLTGDGSLTLTGANTYTGLTTLSGGTLRIGNGGTTGSIVGTGGITNNASLIFNRSDSYSYTGSITGTGTTQVIGGGSLTLSGSLGSTGGVTIDAASTLNIGNGGAGGSISGNILDNGALKFNTTSTGLVVSGSITGAGSLENIAGVTILAGTNNFGTGSSATITGGTLQIGNGGTTGSITGNILDNGVLAFSRSDSSTFAGAISGSGSVLINMSSPSAVKTLSGNNNYGGGVTIAQGVLALGSATAVPSGSSVTVGGAGTSGTLDLNGFNLSVGALATVDVAANQTITNNSSTTNSVLTYNSAAASTFGGLLSNGASRNISLVVTGGGLLDLANANSFTGGVSVLNGTIQLGASGALGTGAITLGTTGTNGVLDLNGFTQTVSSLAVGAGAVAGSQIIGNSSTTSDGFLTINGTSTFGGLIKDVLGSGTFKTGLTVASGTLTLTNANTYTGASQINSGATLQLGSGGTTGSLSNGTTILDNGTLSFNRSDLVTFGATVSGSGGLQQVGSGTLELTGTNSYSGLTVMNNAAGTLKTSGTNSSSTGGTTLTAGTLLLNNTGANNGGLAGGAFTISGGTIDNITGSALTLAANNSVNLNGSFTFTGSNDLNFGTGSVNVGASALTLTIGGTNRTLTLGALTNTAGNINTITVTTGAGSTLVIGSYALSNSATSRVDVLTGNAPNIIINGPVTNGGTSTASGLNYTGTGTLTLNGANNYGGLTSQTTAGGTIIFNGSNSGAGGTTLTAGTIQLGGSVNGGIASVGTLTLTAGTLQTVGTAARTVSNPVTFTAVTVAGSQSLTMSGSFSVVSAAVRTLTNSLTGGALLTIGQSGSGVFLSNSLTAAGGLTITGTANTTVLGDIKDANGAGVSSALSITDTGITTLSGANTYTGLTTMNAATGTLVLSGSNSSAGATTLTAGTLQLNNSSNGGLASGLLTFTLGTVQALNASRSLSNAISLAAVIVSGSQSLAFNGKLTGLTGAARTLTNNIAAGKTLTLSSIDINTETANARTLTIAGSGATTITGAIANGNGTTANGLTITSTGITTLSAAAGVSTYTGTTTAGAGTFVIGATNTLPTANAFVLGTLGAGGAAATLDVSGFDQTVGAFTVSSDSATADQILLASGRTLTINGNVTIGSSSAALTTTNLTASGGGTVTVNNAAASGTFTVGGYAGTTAGQGNLASADFSSLASLSILLNTSSGTIRINNNSTANTTGAYSTLILAPVTTLTASVLAVGDGGQNNNSTTGVNTLKLGATSNTLRVTTLNIGTGTRDFGAFLFNGLTGTVDIANTAGSGGAAFNMGTGSSTTAVTPIATGNTFDVTGHTATLLLTAVTIGTEARAQSYTNDFSFDKGTLTMDSLTASTRTGGAFATTSTINLGSASSTLADTVTINNGILQLAQTTGTGVAGEAVTATVNIAGGTVSIGATSGTAVTMAAAVSNTTSTATINLTGGVTTINGNIVRIGGSGTSSATVSLSGTASLDMAGHNIGTLAQNVSFVTAAGTLANLGELNGGGTFTKTTSGTLLMDGTSTYSGTTAVQAGRLVLKGGSNNRISAATLVVLGNSTTSGVLQLGDASGASDQTIRSLTTSGTGTANAIVAGNATFSTLTVDQTASTTFAGTLGGTGTNENNLNLTKSSAGTLALTGTNTYSGVTTVNGGVLSISSSTNLGDASATNTIAMANGGVLQDTGSSVDLGVNRSVALGTGGGAVDVTSTNVLTVSGTVSGSSLTKTGTGTLVLTGTNTYTGKTVVSAGKLSISDETNLGANPAASTADQLTLNGGTLLTTATLAIDDSNRGITTGASGGTIETASGTTATVNAIITGGALTKEGAGTLLLMASNTNTGVTTVNHGILGGTGTVGADLIVNSGGTVAPGVAAEGRLTLNGALTVSSGGTLLMQLGGATTNDASTVLSQMNSNGNLTGMIGSVPSAWTTYQVGTTQHDNILVSGALSAPVINGTLKIDPTFLYGYTPSYGDIFKLIDWSAAGAITGSTSFDYTGVPLNGLSFNTDLFASNGILVVVPEPSRVLFLMFGLLGLMLRRRRSTAALS